MEARQILEKLSRSREISLRPHYLLTRDNVEELQWESSRSYVIAAASEVFSVSLDLSSIPRDAREKYLSMQAIRHSPYEAAASHAVTFENDQTMLWIWDANWESEQRKSLPVRLREVPLLPETLLHPRGETGAHLRVCSSGYELQIWRNGCMQNRRWYPELPSEVALTTALRAERMETSPIIDDTIEWLASDWPEKVHDWSSLLRDEKTVFTAAGSVVLFLICLNLGLGLGSGIKTSWGEYRVSTLSAELGDQLEERLLAERQRDINSEWVTLIEPYTQLDVVAEFHSALADTDYLLLEWSYDDGGLKAVIYDEDINTRETVSRLAERNLFQELRIEPGRQEGENILTMQLAQTVDQGRQGNE